MTWQIFPYLFPRRDSNHHLQQTKSLWIGPADGTQTPPNSRKHKSLRCSTEPSQPDNPQNEHKEQIEPKVVGDEGEANVRDNYYDYQYYYY